MDEAIKTIYTDDEGERAVILQRKDGLFSVKVEKFYRMCNYEEDYHYEYWGRSENDMVRLLDTLEHAICAVMSEPPFKYDERTE